MSAYAWRCKRCQRLLKATELRQYDGGLHHWDLFVERWCGPVLKVNLQ